MVLDKKRNKKRDRQPSVVETSLTSVAMYGGHAIMVQALLNKRESGLG